MKNGRAMLLLLIVLVAIVAGGYGIVMIFIDLSRDMMRGVQSGDMGELILLLPMVLVAGSLIIAAVVFYKLFIKPGLTERHMRKQGVKSIGFIKLVTQTGTYINEQPELKMDVEVLKEDGTMIHVQVKAVIALIDLAQFQPGALIPVVYDPKTLECIVDGEAEPEALQDMIDRYQAAKDPHGLTYSERVELRKYGINTPAIIKDMNMTGEKHGDKYTVVIVIELPEHVLGSKKIVSREVACSPALMEQLQIGRFIHVQLLPEHPERFAIVSEVNQEIME